MAKYLANSISAQMLTNMTRGVLSFTEISENMFRELTKDAESFMGHHDLAEYLGVQYNRSPVYLETGDMLYVAQVCNARGTTDKEDTIRYFQFYVDG